MSEEQFIIKHSRQKLFVSALITGIMIVWYFIGPYEKTRIIYTESPTFTIILGIVMFGIFFYSLKELIQQKAETTLTKEGIELRDKGFYYWNVIDSFSTLYYSYDENHKVDLILHYKDFADLKFDISHLNIEKDELANLIIKFKGSASLFFAGHNSK